MYDIHVVPFSIRMLVNPVRIVVKCEYRGRKRIKRMFTCSIMLSNKTVDHDEISHEIVVVQESSP